MRLFPLLFLFLFVFMNMTFGQNRPFNPNGGTEIEGQVIDEDTRQPIEYANIVILKSSDTTQVGGTITDADGIFKIPKIKPGNYFVKITFIGFDNSTVNDIEVKSTDRFIDLETITLKSKAYLLEGAEVIATKTPVEYQIDKKVINVSEQATAASSTAVEVLENVPSVSVDIDGNVSLRGSSSFTLLIDGKPTIIEASDLLQQIPASTIDNIEIVTNPSAKHDPEGVSGIINVITKKNQLVGMSGVINAHAGFDNKFGADFVSNYRINGNTYYVGADFREDNYPGTGREERTMFNDEFQTFLESNNSRRFNRKGYNLKAGADFSITTHDMLGVSFNYGDYGFNNNRIVNYYEYTNPATVERNYFNINNGERGGERFSANMNYKKLFTKKDHELSASIDFIKRDGDDTSINEYYDEFSVLESGRKSTEAGPSERIRLKLDYSLPLGEKSMLELGSQSNFRNSTDDTKSFILDVENDSYILENDYSYLVNYTKNTHAVYSMFKNKINNFGYQVGLRGELTDRLIEIPESNNEFNINRWDLFPTLHTSYQFNELVQVMASYTRRIRRPRGWNLEPFLTWQDANNVRRGNPNLEAEYINSFELAYQTHIDDVILSLESYYRVRDNKIERVSAVYDTNVTLSTFENVGTDYTFGFEFMMNANLFKFWNLNFMGDLSDYTLEGTFNNRDYSRNNFNWSIRINNSINLTSTTKLQINAMYNGPSITSQGEFKGFYATNLALKQQLFDKKLALTLQVRDIFQTARFEGTTNGVGFSNSYYNKRKSPMVMLNMTLNLNNYKQKRGNMPGGMSGDEEGGEGAEGQY